MEQIIYYRAVERSIVVAMAPVLLWIGYKLFVLGATGRMTISAKGATITGKLTNVSPGIFCFLAAAALGAFALNDRAEIESEKSNIGVSKTSVAATSPSAANSAKHQQIAASGAIQPESAQYLRKRECRLRQARPAQQS